MSGQRDPANIQVHEFQDTGDAYDQSQCDDNIEMGDILVVESEKVVGFLFSAWPCAVTVDHGAFHSFDKRNPTLLDPEDNGKMLDGSPPRKRRDWRPYFERAKAEAVKRGYELSVD